MTYDEPEYERGNSASSCGEEVSRPGKSTQADEGGSCKNEGLLLGESCAIKQHADSEQTSLASHLFLNDLQDR
jgi:hypothetical protein